MWPTERKTTRAKDRRCFLCVQKGHLATKCNLDIKCRTCGRKHNTLLHGAEVERIQQQQQRTMVTATTAVEDPEGALDHGLLLKGGGRVSLRTIVVWLENPATGQGMEANALLDDGCTQAALVSRRVATALGLKGEAMLAEQREWAVMFNNTTLS